MKLPTEKFSNSTIKSALALNVSLQIVPIVAALISVPYILMLYGKDLFSIYALAVAYIVGLNYLHLGVATNVSRDLASIESTEKSKQAEIFWTGLVSMVLISLLISTLFASSISYYVSSLTAQSIDDVRAIEQFFRNVIYQSPIILLLIFFRAVLESRLQFSITALNRALLNTGLLCAPLIAVLFNISFESIPWIFLLFHVVSLFYLAFSCRYYLTLSLPRFRLKKFYSMFMSGSSLTLISLAMLVFLYGDRYLLSASTDLTQVAYFLAPFDVLARMSFIYGSIGAVFFPVFAQSYAKRDYWELQKMFDISYWLIFVIVGTVIYFVIVFSSDFLAIWLGQGFKTNAAPIMNVLALGILFTGLSTIPSRALIALRQEVVLGFVYVFFAVLYLGFSFALIQHYGAMGAAYAFLARSVLELALLNGLLSYKVKILSVNNGHSYAKAILRTISPFILLFAFLLVGVGFASKLIVSLVFLTTVVGLSFHYWRIFTDTKNGFDNG